MTTYPETACVWRDRPSVDGRLLEQFIQRGLWVRDDQPFFLWAALERLALRFGSFRHIAVQSFCQSDQVPSIPHPGFDPGRSLLPVRPRGCKPRAYASSASGAHRSYLRAARPRVVSLLQVPLSSSLLIRVGIRGRCVVELAGRFDRSRMALARCVRMDRGNRAVVLAAAHEIEIRIGRRIERCGGDQPLSFGASEPEVTNVRLPVVASIRDRSLYVAGFRKSPQDGMDRRQRVALVLGEVVSEGDNPLAHLERSQRTLRVLEDGPAGFRH